MMAAYYISPINIFVIFKFLVLLLISTTIVLSSVLLYTLNSARERGVLNLTLQYAQYQ